MPSHHMTLLIGIGTVILGFSGTTHTRTPENPGVYNSCVGMLPKLNEKPRNSSAGVN